MSARIVSTVIFWLLMTVLVAGALVVVVGLYLPFVALKAAWYAATGRLSEVTGGDAEMSDEADTARPHIG